MSMLDLLGVDKTSATWWDLARCRGMNPSLFFDQAEENPIIYDNIKHVCDSCPVKQSCEEFAVKNREYGIWSGKYYVKGIVKRLHQ